MAAFNILKNLLVLNYLLVLNAITGIFITGILRNLEF